MQQVKLRLVPMAVNQEGRDFGQPAAERLREDDIVGSQAQCLAGQKTPCSPEPGLTFIGDERDLPGSAQIRCTPQEFHGDWTNAAFALDRLKNETGRSPDSREFGLQLLHVVGTQWGDRQSIRCHRMAVQGTRRELLGGQRLPVKRSLQCEKRLSTGFEHRVFHGGLDRLGPRIRQHDTEVPLNTTRQHGR